MAFTNKSTNEMRKGLFLICYRLDARTKTFNTTLMPGFGESTILTVFYCV